MSDHDWLAQRFEDTRAHLRGIAYRMLGSQTEADDAVQEAWLRLSRSDASGIENLTGWLTTVVARVCLDALRSRTSRREAPLDDLPPTAAREPGAEHDAMLAQSVGLAMLVVLETLPPAERVAFVLHDLFDLPFDEIAPILERTSTATRQLASRARRRVQGAPAVPASDLARQRRLVDAYLTAARSGDLGALLAVLDPGVVLRQDGAEVRGADALAARAIKAGARAAQAALVDGAVGIVIAPAGRLRLVLRVTFVDDRIAALDAVTAPEQLRQLELALLDG